MKEPPRPYEVIPILFMLIGIILYWLKIDTGGWLLAIGFLVMGVVYFIQEIRNKSSTGLNKIVRITLPLLVIAMSLQGLIYGRVYFLSILVIMIMYTLFTKRFDPIFKRS